MQWWNPCVKDEQATGYFISNAYTPLLATIEVFWIIEVSMFSLQESMVIPDHVRDMLEKINRMWILMLTNDVNAQQ